MKLRSMMICILTAIVFTSPLFAMDEGTRHITGSDVDVYFMNDKLFGSFSGYPLWAIYNCGQDIKGEIDVKGTYHELSFVYHKEGDKKITGKFGPLEMSLGKMEKGDGKVLYHVFIGDQEYLFSIRYEKLEDGHMVNSIIEGEIEKGKPITLTVDGHLCPFATTGVILITVGSLTIGK